MIDDDKSVFKLKINENNPPSNKIKEPKFGFVLNRSRIIIAIAKNEAKNQYPGSNDFLTTSINLIV